ncbi:hypothetical protein DM806_16775 [Sphingobium lactosutens]|uniref:hypothetical protein n=1 Tax=Sphingobium lactosutens TaxID=522773 RepID=UPI0015BEFB08|nr:hypothetical protein [Sphingobium lactosutens]NWK97294.1 hypothetical protein [Sphingobium lactosutens]
MKARIVSLITVGLVAASTSSAIACLPPSPPTLSRLEGESDDGYAKRLKLFETERVRQEQEEIRQFQLQRDAKNWSSADRVMLAEAVEFGGSLLKPKVRLRPVRWLKGKGKLQSFQLKPVTRDSCEWPGNGDALGGEVGEKFLIFLKPGSPSSKTVLDSISVSRIVGEHSNAALDES